MPYFYLKTGPAYRRIYPITLILPHQTHLGTENALFCHTKRTADINYPCFATPNAPRSQKCLISPHEKQVNTKVTLVNANPEPTGNPSKNPQKHLKKPLPPREVGVRQGGGLGWLGDG